MPGMDGTGPISGSVGRGLGPCGRGGRNGQGMGRLNGGLGAGLGVTERLVALERENALLRQRLASSGTQVRGEGEAEPEGVTE